MNTHFKLMGHGQAVLAAVVAVLFFLTGTFSGWAHAQLIKSDPPDKAELNESPARVDLWFNELLDDDFNSIEVIAAACVVMDSWLRGRVESVTPCMRTT